MKAKEATPRRHPAAIHRYCGKPRKPPAPAKTGAFFSGREGRGNQRAAQTPRARRFRAPGSLLHHHDVFSDFLLQNTSCVLVALLAGFHMLLVGTATALLAGCHMLLMRSMITTASLPAFACDLALLGFIHRCESAVAFLVSHGITPVRNRNVRLATDACHSRSVTVKWI
jgi:hypothetical protein